MLFSAISCVNITAIRYEFEIEKDVVYSCEY